MGVPLGTCLVDAKLYFSKIPANTSLGGGNCLIPRVMADYSTRALIGGTVTATRGPLPVTSNYCGAPCFYEATGSQRITIRPLAGDLTFTAAWNGQNGKTVFVPPFTPSIYHWQVTFAENSVPAGIPKKTLLRSWRKADTTLTGNRTDINECPNHAPPLYPPAACIINVKESGIMTTTTRVNGVIHVDSACVQCLTPFSDSSMDHQVIRNRLMNLSDESNPRASNPDDRIERVTAILRDAPSGQFFTIDVPVDSADQCRSYWHPLDPTGYPNAVIMAYVHRDFYGRPRRWERFGLARHAKPLSAASISGHLQASILRSGK